MHIANGLPAIAVVGLADKSVSESRERLRAALSSIDLALPPKRIAVNLAPADVLKEGAHFDLPIALGLLVAMSVVPQDAVADFVVLGDEPVREKFRWRIMVCCFWMNWPNLPDWVSIHCVSR